MKFNSKKITKLACAAALGGAVLSAASPAMAEDVDWSKFMTSSTVVSAIASGMAALDYCETPLQFAQTAAEGKLSLSMTCAGETEEDNATVIIEFDDIGEGELLPSQFNFAG